ncbi:hypothetical protein EBB07_29230 [Paenibacillaceae bacterium]|nr:hypothetical protein EBB07_29230 [Paenibacillaceae bacterium]
MNTSEIVRFLKENEGTKVQLEGINFYSSDKSFVKDLQLLKTETEGDEIIINGFKITRENVINFRSGSSFGGRFTITISVDDHNPCHELHIVNNEPEINGENQAFKLNSFTRKLIMD